MVPPHMGRGSFEGKAELKARQDRWALKNPNLMYVCQEDEFQMAIIDDAQRHIDQSNAFAIKLTKRDDYSKKVAAENKAKLEEVRR